MADRFKLTNIPRPQPDQTMKSLAALAGIRNGICGPKGIANVMFGLVAARDLEPDFHYGSRNLFHLLNGAGYSSCESFHDHHGAIAFFRPFTNPAIYERARHKLIQNSSFGIATLLGISNMSPFVKGNRYCRSCALSEFESLGYAYPHLSHQIAAIDRCPTHGTLFGVLSKEHRGVVEIWGLLVFDNFSTSLDDFVLEEVKPLPGGAEIAKLGAWIDSLFKGNLAPSPTAARQEAILARHERVARAGSEVRSTPAGIEQLISQTYSAEYLRHVGLPLRDGPTAHWPTQLVGSKVFSDHTLGNLLILSALFDSPQQFNQEITTVSATERVAAKATPPAPGVPRSAMTLSLIKDILCLPRLVDIAEKHGMRREAIGYRLNQNPSLRKRREKHLHSMEQRKNRRALETAFTANPNIKISHFNRGYPKVFSWLIRHDRSWLFSFLAAHGKRATSTDTFIERLRTSGEDENAETLLRNSVQAWITGPTPFRITRQLMFKAVPKRIANHLMKDAYPKTRRVLDEFSETAKQYESRIIDRLASLISEGDVAFAKSWASAIISQFAHKPDVVAQVVELLLMQSKTATAPQDSKAYDHLVARENTVYA